MEGLYHVAFHPRDPCGVFHQGALRFRQHAGVSKHFELRRQQREHFPGRAGARLSGQRYFDVAKPKEPRSEGLWAADGADAGGQHPRRADAQQHRRAHRQNHLRHSHHPHRAGYAARAGQAAKREKMDDGAGRRRRRRAQRPVRCGRAAGGLRQPHHGDKRRVQGEHQRRVSGGKRVPLRALRGARDSESGRAGHGGQAHAVHARQPLCRHCGQQKK